MTTEWQFLVSLNERLRFLRDPVEIQEVVVRLIGEHLQASRVNYAHIEGNEFVSRRCYARGVQPFADRGPVARFGHAIVEASRRGETVVVSDVHADPQFTDAERAQLLASEIAAFVVAPLIKEGRWLASFAVHGATPRSWTHDQIALVEVTAERIWGVGEHARAEEALGRSDDRQAFLHELNGMIRPLADPARILAETCRLVGRHLRVNRVAYGEVDGEYCTIVNDYVDGLPSQAGRFRWTELGGSRIEEILNGGTLFVNDTSTEPHTAAEREALQAAGIGAYICPLLVKDGRFVGSFGIHSREPRVWTADEIALVQDVADRIWTTLEYRKAEAELRSNEERLEFLLRLNDALRPLSDPADVQETAARLLGQHLGTTRAGYAELDGCDFSIRREYTRGVPPLVGPRAGVTLSAELREALRRGETVAVNDVQTDPRLGDGDRTKMLSRQMAAFIGTTLFKGGRMVAAFGVNHVAPRIWTPSEIELVRDVGERTWDAVERTRAEAALREREQRLRLALEASAAGSWTRDAGANRVDWDDGFRRLYGIPFGEPPTFDGWLNRVHAEDRPKVLDLVDDLLHPTKDAWDIVFRIARSDGTVAWIQSVGRVERETGGKITRLVGLELDVTARRQAEEAFQARRDAEHDRALRTLLETATQGIVSVDAQGVIVTANHAFETMFGWAPGDLIGQPIERLLPSAARGAHAWHRTNYFAAPNARRMGGGLYLVGERRDGSTFPIEVSLNHVATPAGGRAFAFVTDITDRQRAASALQERSAELEYRTTQLSRMASELTLAEHHAREQIARTLHDGLQQLLIIVSFNLEQQLKRDREVGSAPSDPLSEAKHHLDEAIAAARSLNFELFPPVLQHSGLPAALTWLANWTHEKHKVYVQVVADPRADSARKDVRTLLFESVRELLLNAVKHAHADRVTLELALDADDQLCITVTDQGIGFEPAALDDRSKTGQVGWGLFSIRERLTLLGGRFDVDSAPDRGTRVRLIAPRGTAQSAVADAGLSSLAPIRPASAEDDGRASPDALRILIVDDHPLVRTALRATLQERPQLSVIGGASNGVEAIAHAHTLRPDVILMDISMPHMDGVEATARIHAELPGIEILGLSMHPRSAVAHPIEKVGAAGFFVKGVDTQRLIDHLLVVHASRRADNPTNRHADSPPRPARG